MSDRERQSKGDCPFCGHWDSDVVKSPGCTEGSGYVRIRKCRRCLHKFQTEEVVKSLQRTDLSLRQSSTSLH